MEMNHVRRGQIYAKKIRCGNFVHHSNAYFVNQNRFVSFQNIPLITVWHAWLLVGSNKHAISGTTLPEAKATANAKSDLSTNEGLGFLKQRIAPSPKGMKRKEGDETCGFQLVRPDRRHKKAATDLRRSALYKREGERAQNNSPQAPFSKTKRILVNRSSRDTCNSPSSWKPAGYSGV